jgi:hypothetical protein
MKYTMKIEREYLTESGIRIPSGTHAARIVHHADLDGVFSAILVMNQLVKQGLDKKNITTQMIDYGDRDNEVNKKLSGKKGQMVVLVDFARLPKGVKKPDVWSDHHVNEAVEDRESKLRSIVKHEIKGVPEKEIANIMGKLRAINIGNDSPEERNRVRKEVTKVEPALAAWVKAVTKNPDLDLFVLLQKEKSKKEERKQLAGTARSASPHSKAGASIGRTEFRSEAEHLATTNASGLADPTTIKAISDIDSATYENLEDVLNLTKNFREKGRMGRLANIVNVLLIDVIKKNPKAVDMIVRGSSPSLVSLYNKILEVVKISNEQKEAIQELSKPEPDWAKIDQIRGKLPKEMAQDVVKGGEIKDLDSLESKRKKSEEDIVKHTTPQVDDKGKKLPPKFKGAGAVIVQDAAGRNAPSRFLGSLLTKPDGTRYPAAMRDWGGMLQISLNPDLPKEFKDRADLTKMMKDAIVEVKREMGNKWSDWSFNIVSSESGGHKGISTLQGMGTIGFLPKVDKKELDELLDLDKRIKNLKFSNVKKLEDLSPGKANRIKELQKKKEKMAEQKTAIKDAIKNRIIEKANEIFSGVSVPPTANPERFKAKGMSVKEDILYQLWKWS